jgi:hypothetical protein
MAVLLAAGLLLSGAPAPGDDTPKKDDAAPGTPPRPTTEHQLLMKRMEGTWDCSIKAYMDPTKPAEESKGVEVNKVVCNGLWLTSDFKSTMLGQPFLGHGLYGYDTAKKRYTGVWVDSMGTSVSTMEGSFDAAGNVFTMTLESPTPDGKTARFKMVTEFKDDASHLFTMSMLDDGGKETKMMTIDYKRKK